MSDTHAQQKTFSHQIVVEGNNQFYYTIKPYELSNALGHRRAILREYNFTKTDDISGQLFGKLYRTNEGNWYDMEAVQLAPEKRILRMLKSAIEAKENNRV